MAAHEISHSALHFLLPPPRSSFKNVKLTNYLSYKATVYVLGRIIRITFISKVPQRLQIISMYKLNDVFEMNPSQLVDFSFLLSIQQQGTTTEARR